MLYDSMYSIWQSVKCQNFVSLVFKYWDDGIALITIDRLKLRWRSALTLKSLLTSPASQAIGSPKNWLKTKLRVKINPWSDYHLSFGHFLNITSLGEDDMSSWWLDSGEKQHLVHTRMTQAPISIGVTWSYKSWSQFDSKNVGVLLRKCEKKVVKNCQKKAFLKLIFSLQLYTACSHSFLVHLVEHLKGPVVDGNIGRTNQEGEDFRKRPNQHVRHLGSVLLPTSGINQWSQVFYSPNLNISDAASEKIYFY